MEKPGKETSREFTQAVKNGPDSAPHPNTPLPQPTWTFRHGDSCFGARLRNRASFLSQNLLRPDFLSPNTEVFASSFNSAENRAKTLDFRDT